MIEDHARIHLQISAMVNRTVIASKSENKARAFEKCLESGPVGGLLDAIFDFHFSGFGFRDKNRNWRQVKLSSRRARPRYL
jgi:hypothetical protein